MEGRTAIDYAIDAGNIDIVRLSIDILRFDLSVSCNKYGNTPLIFAIEKNNTEMSIADRERS